MDKKSEIRAKVIEILDQSRKKMEENLDRVLSSGAVSDDACETGYFLPKAIAVALFREEAEQYGLTNKAFMCEVRNLAAFV